MCVPILNYSCSQLPWYCLVGCCFVATSNKILIVRLLPLIGLSIITYWSSYYHLLDYILSLIELFIYHLLDYINRLKDIQRLPIHHNVPLITINAAGCPPHCTIDQLTCLPAEVLWLHLSLKHLVTSRNKPVMAERLYHALLNVPTVNLLSSLPLCHQSPPHQHRRQRCANQLWHHTCHWQFFPHL